MRRKLPLSLRILLGLGLGVLAGLALQDAPEFAAAWIQPFGTLFLNLVKMLVVPLVFCSLTAGGGRSGGRPAHGPGRRPHPPCSHLCTTALAVALGLLAASLFPVGRGWAIRSPCRPGGGPSFSGGHPAGDCPPQSHQLWPRAYAADPLFRPWPRWAP